jgi:hypothetical protein
LIFINFTTISSLAQGISFPDVDESDDERTARLNVHNDAGQIIDVKTREENGTLVYEAMLDSGWILYERLKPSTYIIEINLHEGQQNLAGFRIVIDGCISLIVSLDELGEIRAETQRCIGPVIDSLNKFGSAVNFPDSIDDAFR